MIRIFRSIGAHPEWRYVALFLLSATLISLTFFIASILIDPWGTFGTGIVRPLVMTNRTEKLASLAKKNPPPELIVYGSSRVFELDPQKISVATGLRTYNASISYARPEEYYAMTRYLSEKLNIKPKGIVVFFLDGEFNDDPIDPQTITHPEFRAYLGISRREVVKMIVKNVKQGASPRFVRDLVRAVGLAAGGTTRAAAIFDENGRQVTDTAGDAKGTSSGPLQNLELAIDLYDNARTAANFRKKKFIEFVQYARHNGATVIAVQLPLPATVKEQLTVTTHYKEYADDFSNFMHENSTYHEFMYFDFSDVQSFGGNETDFNDSTHMNRENLDKMVTHLLNQSKKSYSDLRPTRPQRLSKLMRAMAGAAYYVLRPH